MEDLLCVCCGFTFIIASAEESVSELLNSEGVNPEIWKGSRRY